MWVKRTQIKTSPPPHFSYYFTSHFVCFLVCFFFLPLSLWSLTVWLLFDYIETRTPARAICKSDMNCTGSLFRSFPSLSETTHKFFNTVMQHTHTFDMDGKLSLIFEFYRSGRCFGASFWKRRTHQQSLGRSLACPPPSPFPHSQLP